MNVKESPSKFATVRNEPEVEGLRQAMQLMSIMNVKESPSKFATVRNELEVEGLRQAMQLMSYSCLSQAVTPQELYGQSVCMGAQAMELLAKQVRLRRAAEKRATTLAQEVANLKQRLEVAEASACFQEDEAEEERQVVEAEEKSPH